MTNISLSLKALGNFLALVLLVSVFSLPALAGAGLTYHGRLLRSDSTPVSSSSVQFRIQIRSPGNENCLLYEETQTKDLTGKEGIFALSLNDGSGVVTLINGYSLDRIFQNRGPFTLTGQCVIGNSYNPGVADGRKLHVDFNDGSFAGWEPMPTQTINFVPLAMESLSVGGYQATNLLRIENAGIPQSVTPLTSTQLANLVSVADTGNITGNAATATTAATATSAVNATTAVNFSGSLAGDVTGTQAATVVARLQGRDVSATAPANGEVLKWNGTAWAPAVDGGGGGSVTAVSASVPLASSGGATPDISLAAGSAAGQTLRWGGASWSAAKLNYQDLVNNVAASPWPGASCTSGQFLTWSSVSDNFACTALSGAMVNTALGYTPLNPANNLSDVANAAIARTNLGAGDFLANGSVAMTGNLRLNNNWLSNDGGNEGLRVDNSGNVGIGTASPAKNLDLVGEFQAYKQQTMTSSTVNTHTLEASLSPGSASTAQIRSVYGLARSSSANVSGATLVGVQGEASLSGSAVDTASGLIGYSVSTGTGTITNARGVTGLTDVTSTGTISNARAGYFRVSNSGGGTVTNGYGVYVSTIAATNKWSIYASDATAPSYFAGQVGIGTASPQAPLHVNGIIRANEICDENGANCRDISTGWGGGGTVTSVTSANADIGVATTTSTPVLTLNSGTGANQILKLNASSEIPAVSGVNLTALNASNLGSGTVPAARMPALTGDATMTAGTTSTTVARIQGRNVASTVPLDGQVYRWNNGGTQWEPVYFGVDDLRTAAGASQFSASCAASQTLTWSAVTDAFTCANIAGLNASVITAGTIDSARLPASATFWETATGGINYAGGNVGIGTTNPAATLDIVHADNSSGGIKLASSTGNAVTKTGRLKSGHYTNAQAPVTTVLTTNSAASNLIYIGGGSGSETAATSIEFRTAANNTTLTGTQRMLIDSAGFVGVATVPSFRFHAVETATDENWKVAVAPELSMTTTVNRSSNNYAQYVLSRTAINSGVTDSGALSGIFQRTLRNNWLVSTNDGGTLDRNQGIFANVGHANVNTGISPTTTNTIAFRTGITAASGTIVNSFDLYAEAPTISGAGSITNQYGVYILGASKNNYFEGNVGIGTTSPGQKLTVNGNAKVVGQLSTGSQVISGGTNSIDWSNGNVIRTDYNCGANISFANLHDGGTYTLVITGTGTTQCNFSTTTTGTDAGTVTYRFLPANGTRTASSYTVYTFLRTGTVVLVSWQTGY